MADEQEYENCDDYNPNSTDLGNESGSVTKESSKQTPETSATKIGQHRWIICLLVAVVILFCLVLVLLGLVAHCLTVSKDLICKVRSLDKQLAKTEEESQLDVGNLGITTFERFEDVFYTLNATRIDLQEFKTF